MSDDLHDALALIGLCTVLLGTAWLIHRVIEAYPTRGDHAHYTGMHRSLLQAAQREAGKLHE